jgi:hypothetical protein
VSLGFYILPGPILGLLSEDKIKLGLIIDSPAAVGGGGGFKSEVQHLAQPVRCEDDDEIPTTAALRTRDAGEPAAAGTQPAIDREGAGAQSQFRQP